MLSIAPDAIAPVSVPVATPGFGGPPDPPLPVLDVLLFDEHAASAIASTAVWSTAAAIAGGRYFFTITFSPR